MTRLLTWGELKRRAGDLPDDAIIVPELFAESAKNKYGGTVSLRAVTRRNEALVFHVEEHSWNDPPDAHPYDATLDPDRDFEEWQAANLPMDRT